MKKSIISFLVFVLVFIGALWLIRSKTDPDVRLSAVQDLQQWHGQVENEYGTYDGALIGDLFQGKGSFRFLTGQVYAGSWQESQMSGNGTLVFPGIGTYTGEMTDSVRNGHGSFEWKSGERYEGGWKDDQMTGEGSYTFSENCTLTGTFENGRPVSGVLSYKEKAGPDDADTKIVSLSYSFSENKEKKIMFETKGGLKYNGDLSALFETGTAEITYPSGNTYTGSLANGQRDGLGTYEWKNQNGGTTASYTGKWSSDHMNGEGKYHYTATAYPFLSGSFENDLPTGTLTYYKAQENTFETQWVNGSCISVKES